MAQITITTPAVDIAEYFNTSASGKHSSRAEWEPIEYTSMSGWMFLNYTLLSLLLSIPAVLIAGLI